MISVQQLSYGYDTRQSILSDISLDFSSGKIYGVLGKNGAGKTTLLKNLLGLRYADKGHISINEYAVYKRQKDLLADYFYIAEEPFIPKISVRRFVQSYAPFYPCFDLNQFFGLLNEFELTRKSHLKALSFGQRKKVLIAFAIAANTRLIIMDEPTNGLDIPSKKQFRKIINYIISNDRLSIISTHQIRDLHALIDHVIILDQGKIIVDNSLELISKALSFEIYRSEPHETDIIYHERVPGGYLAIKEGGHRPESLEVDLEVLFNAVMSDKTLFTHILKSKNYVATH